MLTRSRHPALSAGIAYEDHHFTLRGKCSVVVDDLSVALVFLGMDTTSMERDESEWFPQIKVSGSIRQRGCPVAVRIQLQDRQVDVQVALDTPCLLENTVTVQHAATALDEVMASLDQLVTSLILARRANPSEVTVMAVVPQALPS